MLSYESMNLTFIMLGAGLLTGAMLTLLALFFTKKRQYTWAEEEAADLIDSAKKDTDAQMEELKLQMEEVSDEAYAKFERETRKLVQRNEEFAETLDERESKFRETAQSRDSMLNRRSQSYQARQQKMAQYEARVNSLRNRLTELKGLLFEEAKKKSAASLDELRKSIHSRIEDEVRKVAARNASIIESEAQLNAERDAKKIINLVLNRFARPYCAERGIGNVDFDNPDHKARTFGPDNKYVDAIEKLCGVDIVYNETYSSATVMGFDPVRRELGRLVLEAASKDRGLNEAKINGIYERCKKDLFKKILTDGNRVANELRIPDMKEDVRNMLGALRYRYSFAQNQHFHVAEVGWLCGLMSAELNLNIQDGRRAGLLHDIGKAMDHSKEGGHAVNGAEFIEQHGEKPEIVHAVRAHHYDEPPSTDLAFLTIAADALSGARPGARRSTADSYSQKMADLEKIGSGFPGVLGTYILSAGREVRVVVDGQRIDDMRALNLSKDIAKKIEDEMNYPGQIKVTVVREVQAVEFAR